VSSGIVVRRAADVARMPASATGPPIMRASSPAHVSKPAVVSHDIAPKHSGTAGSIDADSAFTTIVRPRLPAIMLSADA
jgi:hypothetical protein